ncbi:MAG: pilus assembly protein [Candidatus Thiodiazotropha sp. (ex Lucinoma borealis)]|nr:pilus assembly protein [Candidatus Thiodiazotropha sp. (ex Lucinoma borealis)]
MPIIGNMSRWFSRQRGVAMTELLVSLPALLLMGLGGWQTALLYDAKTTLNYATFEAARSGAVSHAQSDPMRQELGLRLVPLFGGDGSAEKAITALTRSSLDVQDNRFTQIDIINPTVEAFDDFGRDIVNPRTNETHFAIPNSHLRWRNRSVSENSGVNIQDANLLKVKVTYGYQLKVPLMDRVIPAVMRLVDPEHALYYNSRRLPITSVATVRMQSDAWRDDNNRHADGHGGGATPPSADDDPDEADTAPDEEDGQGGDDDTTDDSDASAGDGQDTDNSDSGDTDTGDSDSDDNGDDLPPISDSDDQGPPPCDQMSTENDETASPTSQSSGIASTHTGNPIHVVTGNKYQQEVDLTPLPGALGLLFKRHYNSHNDESGPLGHGWGYSYDLQLKAAGDGYRLRQSNGRVIHFEPTEILDSYSAPRVSDGWLQVNEAQSTWHWRDGRQLQFSPEGKIQRIVLATGQTLSLFYNPQGELFLVRDPQGRELSLDHYPNGRIKALYDPTGQETRYRYDAVGNLQQVTRTDDSTRIYHYEDPHDKHNLTGITDERGIRYATWAYDNQDRAILSTHADQVGQVKLDFSTPGETQVTDSQGKLSIYSTEVRDGVALVTAIHGPGCSSCGKGDVSYRYNENLQLSEIATKDGITKHYDHDVKGRLVQISKTVKDKNGKTISEVIAKYAYLGDSTLPVVITEPSVNPERMHQWWLAYNNQRQIEEVIEVGYSPDFDDGFTEMERATLYTYKDGHLATIDGPLPGDIDLQIYHYDEKGRLLSVESPNGEGASIEAFDVYGRPSRLRNNKGKQFELKYNALGWLLSVNSEKSNHLTSFEYDPVGNVLAVNGPKGRVEAEYDKAGRPTTIVLPDDRKKRLNWDTENRLLKQALIDSTGANKFVMSYLYDEQSNLVEESNLQNEVRHYGYDEKGILKSYTDPMGVVSKYVNDPFNRIITITRAAGTPSAVTESLQYDPNEVITALTDGRGNVARQAVDDFGHRLWRSTPDSGNVLYSYNTFGQVAAKVDEIGVITRYDYDKKGRLVGVGSFDKSPTTRLSYLDDNKLINLEGANQSTKYIYDHDGRITETSVSIKGLNNKLTTKYSYDAQGRPIEKLLASGQSVMFEYANNKADFPSRIARFQVITAIQLRSK